MKTLKYTFLTMVMAAAAVAGPTFTVDPSPLVGNNGTYGWGFSLINDTSSYLSVDSVQLYSPVDDPAFRFGPAGNFTDLFSTYQFNQPTILIAPDSTYSQAYNGSDQGLASWLFPDGTGVYDGLLSNVFQIEVNYSLYNDNAYASPTLDPNSQALTGSIFADAQLQFTAAAVSTSGTPEPSTWMLLASGLLVTFSARRRLQKA
jgi:hypothetical protein